MTDMFALPVDRLTRLIADYPTTADDVLAERYDTTTATVERIARRNQLHKQHHDAVAAAVKGHEGRQLAPDPHPRPTVHDTDYCRSCGQSNHHWPGCPHHGHDNRPLLPTG